jgi:hypothetical protein
MYAADTPRQITVHRCNIRKDLIEIFADSTIIDCFIDITVIDPRGKPEAGKGRGVVLDVVTQFWNECFTSLTVGRKAKMLFICHDMQKREWEAFARILFFGYKKYKYFPIQLSPLFIASCLFGEQCITTEFLLTSFKDYIAADHQDTLDQCLSPEFDEVNDDITEFLSSLKCFRLPSKETIHEIIYELAHQELVQKPRYIVNYCTPIVQQLKLFPDFKTVGSLQEFIKSKIPTAKKIVKLFKSEPSNDAERESFDHLKRFVKSLEGKELSRFLNFTTGGDMITCDSITITFSSLDGFKRRPMIRTCVPLIELPSTYESYIALAEEFLNLMKQEQAWSFDIE